ncbi:MAG: metalloregulator ArsR/SmtB family transcription factor [Cyanobacteriota bacterium]|nr:metalloregulator ArsR/SmtB family transcription factor [Cyanobacteriota bacterium]
MSFVESIPSNLIVLGFRALSEPLRLQVLELLRQEELCVCDLCDRLETAQSKLSFHLKVLKEAELVRPRQEGRWVYYSLNLPQLVALEQYLAEYRRFSPMLPARSCDPSSENE